MNKIIVIGCPGAGKSTFAKEIKRIYNIPLYHLDLIWNKPDKTTITREKFDEKLNNIFKEKEWIIDGNYQRTLEKRIIEANTIYLLDYSLDVCLLGVEERIGVKRDDMPWFEEKLDKEFRQKIIEFSSYKLPEIYSLLDKYKETKNIVIFKNREESSKYLKGLYNKKGSDNNE